MTTISVIEAVPASCQQQACPDPPRERAKAEGGRLHEPSPELMAATREFVEKDLQSIVSYYGERHNVQRAEEMLTTFRELLDKWVDLVQGVESAEELADLYWNEVASKVDVSTHGLQ